MTRTEALAIITSALYTVDATTLKAAATYIAQWAAATGASAGDIRAAFAAQGDVPRELTAR